MKEQIRKKLLTLQDLKYKEFHSSICPNTDNIIGIRIPVLRAYTKKLLQQYNGKDLLKQIGDKYYEEIMLQGMIIGMAKLSIDETFETLKIFIPKIDNWAVCDTCCAGLKITKKYADSMWDFLNLYLYSKREFEIRFGLVMLLDYYITDEYIDKILEIVNSISCEGYYVKMAKAWLLSVCYVKQKEKTMQYLKENNLDNWTYNKTLQKIIESNRVAKKEKYIIRKMKKVDF